MKIRSIKKRLSLFFILIFFGITGCGSDGTISSGAAGGGAVPVGDVTFTVKWDETPLRSAANKILNAAQGIKVTVTGARIAVPMIGGVNRTAGSPQETVTLTAVPTGDNTFLIEVFNTAWEEGADANLIQKQAAPFTVQEGSNLLSVNLAPDLCFTLAVIPAFKTLGVGDSELFEAVPMNADNDILLAASVTWSSSDPSVASIDSNGRAAALKRGMTTLTATCDNRSGNATLNVIVARPENVAAAAGDGNVTLTWSPVTGASGYKVYRRTTPGVNKLNGTAATAAGSQATINNLANGTTYYFVVTALIGTEESFDSEEVSATPVISTGTVQIVIQ